jgi:hypothetical protein
MDFYLRPPAGLRVQQAIELNPAGVRHLWVQNQLGTAGRREHERSDCDGGEYWASRYHIVKRTGQVLRQENEPHLLRGFPDGRGQEIGISRLAPTARQRYVPGPGITGPLCPSNQEDRIGIRDKNDGHRSPGQRRVAIDTGLLLSQAFAQAREPAGQCE